MGAESGDRFLVPFKEDPLTHALGRHQAGTLQRGQVRGHRRLRQACALIDQPRAHPEFERVLREVQALSAVSHPGIVQYIDHGITRTGAPYLVTEWLDGADLENRLFDGPLTVEESLALGIRLAEALAAAHEHGVIHRDL